VLRTLESARAGSLGTALGRLPLVIEAAACGVGSALVPTYPGGVRPTSTVVLHGGGAEGLGEHVAWTDEAHVALATRVGTMPGGRWTLDAWSAGLPARFPEPYERAALEAAAIDLALRQQRTNLFALAGVAPAPVRYVVSFERVSDPIARARAEAPGVGLKIDADPDWPDAIWSALGGLGSVAVIDFKLSGSSADHERAHRAVPGALIEDPLGSSTPWSDSLRARFSVDGPVTSPEALAALPVRPAAANLKPARMGGVLRALEAAAWCNTRGIAVYFGGMFEVGVGRSQLHALASLLCPDAPNDVAPIGLASLVAPRPERLRCDPDAPGFGAGAGRG
jgi:L-alanine-DL-glutamate epimerase-like enolase superfamily enzyme